MPLTTFAAAVAVAVSLMFVTVLLASGALALERDQNTFGRLVRGPVSRTALLAEKGLFAVAGALPVTLLMLLAWPRSRRSSGTASTCGSSAIAVAAVAFAAMGTLIGALAREVQAASLLAFTLLLPVAFLALVPSGAVSPAVHDVTQACRSCSRSTRPWMPCAPRCIRAEAWPAPCCTWAPWRWPIGLASRVAIRRFG